MSTFQFDGIDVSELLGITVAILDCVPEDALYLVGPKGDMTKVIGIAADGDLRLRWQKLGESMMLKHIAMAAAFLLTTACASTGVTQPYSAFDVAQSYQLMASALCCREEAPLIEGESHKAYLPKLVAFATRHNIKVEFLDEPLLDNPNLWGINFGALIWIRSSFPLNTQVATLAHELGHSFQPKKLEGFEPQLFAESVSLVYCRRIGLEVWQSSYVYFGRRNTEEYATFIRQHSQEIDAVVDALLTEE